MRHLRVKLIPAVKHRAKHFFYASGWKKFEPLWNFMIRARQLGCMTPMLAAVLSRVSRVDGQPEEVSMKGCTV
jgi:hypothetical protein